MNGDLRHPGRSDHPHLPGVQRVGLDDDISGHLDGLRAQDLLVLSWDGVSLGQ